MAWGYVQGSAVAVSASSTDAVTLTTSVTAGNRLIVWAYVYGSGITLTKVSDSKGNQGATSGQYDQVLSQPDQFSGHLYCLTAPVTTGGSTTITATASGNASYMTVWAGEYSGLSTATGSAAWDVSGGAKGTITPSQTATTSAAVGAAGELAVAAYGDTYVGDASSNLAQLNAPTGWTRRLSWGNWTGGSQIPLEVDDQTPTSGSTSSATWSWTSSISDANNGWAGAIVVFKLASGGGGTTALAAASTSSSSATAALAVTVPAAGGSTSTSSCTAALTVSVPQAAASTSTSSCTAALTVTVPLAAATASTSAGTAAPSLGVALTASVASASSASATPTLSVALQAASVSTSSATASLAGQSHLSAASTSTSSATAALSVTVQLTASSTSTSAMTASPAGRQALTASSSSASSCTAALSVRVPLVAASTSFSAEAATLLLTLPLVAASQSSSSAAAGLAVGMALAAASLSVSGASAQPSLGVALAAASLSISGASLTVGSNANYVASVLGDDPLAYWRLNETSGTVARDSSGNGYDAQIGSSVSLAAPPVILGSDSSMRFAPGNAATESVHAALPALGNAWSWEVWFEGDPAMGTGAYHYLLTTGTTAAPGLYLNPQNSLVFTPGVNTIGKVGPFDDGAVHHAVVSWDGTTLSLYADGALAQSTTTPNPAANLNLAAGSFYIAGVNGSWLGRLGQAAVYPYALSPAQVAYRYQVGVTGQWLLPAATCVSTSVVEAVLWRIGAREAWKRTSSLLTTTGPTRSAVTTLGPTTAPVTTTGPTQSVAGEL